MSRALILPIPDALFGHRQFVTVVSPGRR